jgi:hypothetical protein
MRGLIDSRRPSQVGRIFRSEREWTPSLSCDVPSVPRTNNLDLVIGTEHSDGSVVLLVSEAPFDSLPSVDNNQYPTSLCPAIRVCEPAGGAGFDDSAAADAALIGLSALH